MASDNSGDVYAFTNSVSETSERNILSVMESIRATLQEMLSEVANLEPHWVAVEADGYYEADRKMNENAKQSADILESVEAALKSVREGTGELRDSIWEVLSNSV